MKLPAHRSSLGAVALAFGVLAAARPVLAQNAFTAGNLVVDRVGNGSAALSSAGTAIFLDEFTIQGTRVQSIGLATDGSSVVQSGTATSEGLLHFTSDGSSLVIAGYSTSAGTASVASSTTIPRAIAEFNLSGSQNNVTQLGTAFSGNNVRGATGTSASTLFATGATTGVVTATAGTNGSTIVSTTNTNNRDVNVFGGNLYFTAAAGTRGLYEVNGTPTTAGTNTATLVFATSSTSGPSGFSVSSDGTTAYVADSVLNTLTKYTRAGSTGPFTQAYMTTIAAGVTSLTVSYGTTNTIYFDNPTSIFSSVDSGTVFGSINTLATAGANTAFRGLDLVPGVAPVPEPATVFAGCLLVGAFSWSQRRRVGGLLRTIFSTRGGV